ncbi:hypothetical protein SAMN02910447_00760 [Ruminococcus sp. YE71]|uniref:hypothetical protein n=1 Tax=unclassified Ruminococcus TaxID=2608920 RepID=UPI000886AF61|nr:MULTISPECIES: hypothetical protein [unclassified Ruminococcus]SDA13981.1 hypothetical protein SAMN02910446_00759 [Ruminococcus sp. YE78]SFW20249.1 hypothetical protein SAMN02910447_00760 [Ruminococcus sp. YE71]
MKALKIFLRIFFTIFFISLIFLIVIVCTYVLGSPDTTIGTDCRRLVSGPWTQVMNKDLDEEKVYKLLFDQGGNFQIVIGKKEIAKGWYKFDEKGHKFKLLMKPDDYSEEFAPFVKYKVLSEVAFSNLDYNLPKDFKSGDEIEKDMEPTCTFLIRPVDASQDSLVLDCEMKEYTLDLYNSERDLTKDA